MIASNSDKNGGFQEKSQFLSLPSRVLFYRMIDQPESWRSPENGEVAGKEGGECRAPIKRPRMGKIPLYSQ
jgi:hypothetical protein